MSWIVRVSLFCVLLSVTIAAWGGQAPLVFAQDQIAVDSMDSPDIGLLSNQSSNPDHYLIGYQNSQYVIQGLEPSYNGDVYSFIGLPDSTNTQVEVDVAIAGDPRGKYALIGCRAGANDTGYMFEVHPENGSVALWRSNFDGTFTGLSAVEVSPAVLTGSATNHIAIDCEQNVITGSVNGQPLVSATDDTYASGQSYIGAGAGGATVDGLLAGFDNLTITDRGGATNVGPGQVTTAAQDGMIPITDPRVDPQGTLDDALWVAITEDPSANQLAGIGRSGQRIPHYARQCGAERLLLLSCISRLRRNIRWAHGRLGSASGPMPPATSTTSSCRWITASRPGISVRERPAAVTRCFNPVRFPRGRSI